MTARCFSVESKFMAFRKGVSGNPGGKSKALANVRVLARSYSREAIETLAKLMRNKKYPGVQVAAANAILDRAYGKPSTDPERGEHLTITIKQIVNGRLEVVGGNANGHDAKSPLVIEHDPTEGADK